MPDVEAMAARAMQVDPPDWATLAVVAALRELTEQVRATGAAVTAELEEVRRSLDDIQREGIGPPQ